MSRTQDYAIVAMEDDGRFNAGSGAVLCPDGTTVEMDASIMDTRGRPGRVRAPDGHCAVALS